ncbi:hypothetical protein ANCCEY_04347 [Ancylostoma ceylanicum]|uniref:Alpha-ketoglutarate-dependent dioxygenase AlkB-like domain-containing protein n=1 Tax=Ancylostoma ceylanicum TaxID=53326 RepID=A0A0D6LZD2_9BILA|nr:hypothetical protein ANCCEY_04347 [Ancylostoma ceylanicum]
MNEAGSLMIVKRDEMSRNKVAAKEKAKKNSSMHAESEEERYVGSMLLEPRSLFLMTDDAYENLLHGIKEVSEDVIDEKVFNGEEHRGKTLVRGTRNIKKSFRRYRDALSDNAIAKLVGGFGSLAVAFFLEKERIR